MSLKSTYLSIMNSFKVYIFNIIIVIIVSMIYVNRSHTNDNCKKKNKTSYQINTITHCNRASMRS